MTSMVHLEVAIADGKCAILYQGRTFLAPYDGLADTLPPPKGVGVGLGTFGGDTRPCMEDIVAFLQRAGFRSIAAITEPPQL